jgi:hypothetical protein
VLNVALFGTTAKEWREQNKGKGGNIRDRAMVEQLVVLSKSGKHQCGTYPARYYSIRPAGCVELNRHSSNALITVNPRNTKIQMTNLCHYRFPLYTHKLISYSELLT